MLVTDIQQSGLEFEASVSSAVAKQVIVSSMRPEDPWNVQMD